MSAVRLAVAITFVFLLPASLPAAGVADEGSRRLPALGPATSLRLPEPIASRDGAADPFIPHEAVAPTGAAARVLRILARVERTVRSTAYRHTAFIDARRGVYLWDCSSMVTWVLRRSARRARYAINRSRPVAKSYAHVIQHAPTAGYQQGWQRIAHIEDVRPGDVFAWRRPRDWPRRSTGHVGFVLEAPRPVDAWPHAYVARIADSTSVPHQHDSRPYPGPGGFGTGVILWLTDGHGQATAYGWFGTASRGVVETPTYFGRVHH